MEMTMSLTIAGIDFAQHHYDDRGDVLYLNAEGYERFGGVPPAGYETAEGHHVEYDEAGRVVSIVLINVRWLLERDGEITITWPPGHVKATELAAALQPAA
jgi:YD repeat-containing protein